MSMNLIAYFLNRNILFSTLQKEDSENQNNNINKNTENSSDSCRRTSHRRGE